MWKILGNRQFQPTRVHQPFGLVLIDRPIDVNAYRTTHDTQTKKIDAKSSPRRGPVRLPCPPTRTVRIHAPSKPPPIRDNQIVGGDVQEAEVEPLTADERKESRLSFIEGWTLTDFRIDHLVATERIGFHPCGRPRWLVRTAPGRADKPGWTEPRGWASRAMGIVRPRR